MVDAHMDELGGLVRRITPDGFLTMQLLGGWLDQALVDQRWTILGSKGPVLAVTGIRDAHLATAAERTRVIPRESVFLDVGARSAEEVKQMGLGPGDPIAPEAPFAVLNGTRNYLGKAWDDRAGCAVMIEAMMRLSREPHANSIYWTATVQEEIGLRGARTSAELIRPDVAIAIEAGVTRDVPGVSPDEAQEVLGGGPGLFLFNTSQLPNRKFVALVKRVAAERKIPLQLELVLGYGDDSAEIQKSRGGVPTVCIVVPTRYTHAHNGIINRDDFDRTVDCWSRSASIEAALDPCVPCNDRVSELRPRLSPTGRAKLSKPLPPKPSWMHPGLWCKIRASKRIGPRRASEYRQAETAVRSRPGNREPAHLTRPASWCPGVPPHPPLTGSRKVRMADGPGRRLRTAALNSVSHSGVGLIWRKRKRKPSRS